MHLGDLDVGMLPAIAIVGGGNTVVTRLGPRLQAQRRGSVAVCFFGEGATNEGAFHEGLNFAAVQRLPIVFVCENNLYGASTPFGAVSLVTTWRTARPPTACRANRRRHGRPRRPRGRGRRHRRARAGEGPTLLECKTYRFVGHSRSDARGYRTREEEAEWREPRSRSSPRGRDPGRASADELDEAEVEAELDDAVEFARSLTRPRSGGAARAMSTPETATAPADRRRGTARGDLRGDARDDSVFLIGEDIGSRVDSEAPSASTSACPRARPRADHRHADLEKVIAGAA